MKQKPLYKALTHNILLTSLVREINTVTNEQPGKMSKTRPDIIFWITSHCLHSFNRDTKTLLPPDFFF